MNGWKTIVTLIAFAGCASLRTAADRDPAVGRWKGEIDRGGWLQPLAFEIEKHGNSYRGDWRSEPGVPDQPLQKIEVAGETVRLETDKLVFLGHLQGSKLLGTVSRKDTHVREGQFSLAQDDWRWGDYEPGTEPELPLSQ
jgi:hypothetical protein